MLELIETSANLAPPGAVVSAVRTSDGKTLRVASWAPGHRTRGTVAIFQGRAEFIEKYFETIAELLARGFQVATMDWRGQGGSERELANPRKGHVDDFSLYQRDLDAFTEQVVEFLCPQPWFALAHSMGAAILLEQAHRGRSPFQRLVLTAPMIDLARLRFPRIARALADALDMVGLGAMFIPGGKETSLAEEGFAGNKLTSDAARFARNAAILSKAPQLAIGDPTIGWLNAAFRQMKQFAAPEYPRGARAPALLVACGQDEIVSLRAIERFAARLEVANLITIPAARHEILMEQDAARAQFWAAFDAFVPGAVAREPERGGAG
ncbi:MAG: alpha/beta hydrolase [Methylocystis sp.]|nr:alpha/beta hydrolase [Methylocystis sp.]MBI3275410.1 alpha/beta hydrolase [Methylocystis sp.]